jgi:uncharacterized membrane protein
VITPPEILVSMSARNLRLVGLLVASLALGCGGSEEPTMMRVRVLPGPLTNATCPTPQTLTFANFGEAFMKKYCLVCHSESLPAEKRTAAPLGADYDTVERIRELKTSIDRYTAIGPSAANRLMPIAGPMPTDDERTMLGAWLACGAP